jgi:hypothetical protein
MAGGSNPPDPGQAREGSEAKQKGLQVVKKEAVAQTPRNPFIGEIVISVVLPAWAEASFLCFEVE